MTRRASFQVCIIVGSGLLGILSCPAVSATTDSLSARLTACAESVRRLRESNRDSAAVELGRRWVPPIIPEASAAGATRLYLEIGLCERRLGRFLAGIETTRNALTWAERGRDTVCIERSRYLLAVLYADRGDYTRAIAQCHANLNWYRNAPNGHRLADNYLLLSAVYEHLRNQPAADRYQNAYQRLAFRSPDPERRLIAYSNEATRLGKRRLYRQAVGYQRKAIALIYSLKAGDQPDYLISMLIKQAELQRLANSPAAALTSLAKALDYLPRYDTPILRALMQQETAAALLALNRLPEATEAGQLALQYARQSGRPDVLLDVLNTWQRIQERSGAYRDALATAQAAYNLADSLATVAKVGAIAEVETRYDVARKEADLLALKKEAALHRLQAEIRQRDLQTAHEQRRWLFIGVVVALLVLFVIGYLLRRALHLHRQTEQQRQTLEEQATQLHTANTTKDRVFSIIGHDLRSSALQLHQSLAQVVPPVGGPENATLRQAERGAYFLNQQLNNLLYWALAQQDGLQVHRRVERLDELVAEALDDFGSSLARKSLYLLNQTGPEEVVTDERLTLLVLRNLFHNAIKFTPPGGQITLCSQQTDRAIVLRIRDTGPGPDATRTQGGNSKTEASTGLGLLVSEELMRSCGGSLRLRHAEPHGAEVILEFPV